MIQRMSALGQKQTFCDYPPKCPLSGVKQTSGRRRQSVEGWVRPSNQKFVIPNRFFRILGRFKARWCVSRRLSAPDARMTRMEPKRAFICGLFCRLLPLLNHNILIFITYYKKWRRGWDSNPRYPRGYTGFRVRLIIYNYL